MAVLLVTLGLVGIAVLVLASARNSVPVSNPGGLQPAQTWTTGITVTSIAFGPDGQLLATGMHDGSIQLRRTSDGALVHMLKGHNDVVEVVAFSPDGKFLASGGGAQDAAIHLWSVPDGKPVSTLLDHKFAIQTLAFSPDGQALASGGNDGKVRLWTTADGRLRSRLNGPHEQEPKQPAILHVAFIQNGQTLSVEFADGTVVQWSMPNAELLHTYGTPASLSDQYWLAQRMDMTADGRLVVASGYQTPDVYVWQVDNGHLLSTYGEHRSGVAALAISPDGQLVASAGGYKITGSDEDWIGKDNAIHVWDIASAKRILVFEGLDARVTGLAWSPDGHLLASGSDDGTVRLWQVK